MRCGSRSLRRCRNAYCAAASWRELGDFQTIGPNREQQLNDLRLSLEALLVFLVLTGAVFALIGSWAAKPPGLAKHLYGSIKGTTLGRAPC